MAAPANRPRASFEANRQLQRQDSAGNLIPQPANAENTRPLVRKLLMLF